MFVVNSTIIAAFQWGIVIGASLAAAVIDLRTRRIPNMLTLPVLAAGLVWAGLTGGILGIANAAGACLLLALPFVFLFLFAGGGAGDAKLMGAIGAWLGFSQGVTALLCVVVAGIIFAVAKAAMHRRLKRVTANVFISFYNLMLFVMCFKTQGCVTNRNNIVVESDALIVPYGIAIFAGVCTAGGIVLL